MFSSPFVRAAFLLVPLHTIGVCSHADSEILLSVDVPPTARQIISRLGSEFLVVAYQDSERVVVVGTRFRDDAQWTRAFDAQTLVSLDTDDKGKTVVVCMATSGESITSIVLGRGIDVFSHKDNVVKISRGGRYFYPDDHQNRDWVSDDASRRLNVLGERQGHYVFAGKDHLLVVSWESEAEPRKLALMQLPGKVKWATQVAPGEPNLEWVTEESLAMSDDMLVLAERGMAGSSQEIYCFDDNGRVKWKQKAPGIRAIAILGRYRVISAGTGSFTVLDAKDGKVVSESPSLAAMTSIDGAAIAEVTQVVADGEWVIFNVLTYTKREFPTEASILVRLVNGDIQYEVLKEFSQVTVAGSKLVGVPRNNPTTVIEVSESRR